MTTSTARQVIAPRYGGPDVVELTEVEVPQAGPGQVTIDVRAAGMNPADFKGFAGGPTADPAALPIRPGYEVAGVVVGLGADTELASGGGAIGDEVLAFRVSGGYASRITVPAKDVFAKPAALDFPAAANLLLAGSTAEDMLRVVHAAAGETVLVHGASGAVGVMLLQLARLRGIAVVGTASDARAEVVRGFGATPVPYGRGLLDRVRALAPEEGYAAALDCVGTDEAVDVSLAVAPKDRVVTIAAQARAKRDGFLAVGGRDPESAVFRDGVRAGLIDLAADGRLVVPIARTYPLEAAAEALAVLAEGHPGGKLALVP
ncbi:NADP-dependent oxidoreductase [Amnibacterium sp.]|uniref:NADP-dependent oxidoreductase n=1 Tax=Amnibacterium sp. TaxID=1872496 RepID=UPI003F7BEED0